MNKQFTDFLDSMVNRAPAKEELDGNSSTDEFVEAIAQYSADFIKQNRNAFNLDDHEAVAELVKVIGVDSVTSRIFDILQSNEEIEKTEKTDSSEQSETVQSDDTIKEEKTDIKSDSSSSSDSNYVSEDIMKLLDE